MNIFKNFNVWRKEPPKESANPTPSFEVVGTPMAPQNPIQEPVKTSRWSYFYNKGMFNNESEKEITFDKMRFLAKNVTEIASCVNTLNSFLTRVKFDFRDVKSKEVNRLNVRRVSNIFLNNQHLPFRKLQESIITETCITDALTIYPVRSLAGEVIRFRILDGKNVKVVLNDYQEIYGYTYMLDGTNKIINYKIEDLLYMPKNLSADRFYGCSYVEQLAETAELLLSKRKETKDFYENGNYPNLLIGLPNDLTQQDVKSFEKYWNSTTMGIKKSIAKFLPGGSSIHFTKENVTGEDLQIERYQREVYSIFRLSPSLLIKDSNRATAEVSSRIAEEVGMLDMLDWVRDTINHLIKFYIKDDTVECFYTIDTVVDQEKEARVHQIYLDSGVLTINEVREVLGKKPFKDDELPKDDDNPPENDDKNEEKGKGFLNNLVTKSSKMDEFDKELEKNKDELAKVLTAYLVAQDSNIQSILKTYDLKSITEDKVGMALELPAKELEEYITNVNSKFLDAGLVAIDKSFDANSYNNAETYEKLVIQSEDLTYARAAELVGKKFVKGKLVDNPNAKYVINDTTRSDLKNLIGKAMDEGWSNDQLAQEIQKAGTFSESRAMTIARTETAELSSQISVKSYKEMDLKKKIWLTANDNDVCEECVKNEMQGPIDLDKAFANGKFHPPSHPNCRCSIAPHIE